MDEINKRLLYRVKILNYLREGPKKFSQIVKDCKIPKKTVNRILNEFKVLKIVDKNKEGLWVWHEYFARFNSLAEHELALEHSRKLINGLKTILAVLLPATTQQIDHQDSKLREFAEQHLKTGYPEIHQKILEFRKTDRDTEELLAKSMQSFNEAELFPPERFKQMKWKRVERKGLLRKIFPEYKLKRVDVPYAYGFDNIEDAREALRKANAFAEIAKMDSSGKCFILGPIYVKGPEKIYNQMLETYGEVAKRLHSLIMRIDHGQPLSGKCDLCPKITIS